MLGGVGGGEGWWFSLFFFCDNGCLVVRCAGKEERRGEEIYIWVGLGWIRYDCLD